MSAQNASAITTSTNTWSGNMETANNTGYTITNVAFEHCCEGVATVTGFAQTLDNNGDSSPFSFSTAKGNDDNWFISFIDQSGNLITGSLQEDFHESSAGSTVEISLLPTSFSISWSGKTYTATYDQKKV